MGTLETLCMRLKMNNDKITDVARGKWREIHSAIGIPSTYLRTTKHTACPFCGGKDRYRYTDWKGNGGFICNQCHPNGGNGIDLVMKYLKCTLPYACDRIRKLSGNYKPVIRKITMDNDKLNNEAVNLWRNAKEAVKGDAVSRYMYNRLRIDNVSPALRLVSDYTYFDKESNKTTIHECMVAIVQGPDGKPVSAHRTYLDKSGYKAKVECAKKMMPGSIPAGSAIRLAKAGKTLGIAEGIETALAASILYGGIPVWSCISAKVMEKFVPPEGVERLLIFADNDENFVGQLSAYTLANKLATNSKLTVEVEIPYRKGIDYCDMLEDKYNIN